MNAEPGARAGRSGCARVDGPACPNPDLRRPVGPARRSAGGRAGRNRGGRDPHRPPERYAEPDRGPYTLAPDWICEILSPSTAAVDRGEEQPLYARSSVAHLWLMDPSAKTLEVLRLGGDLWIVAAVFTGDAVVRAEPFDAIELDLGKVWRGRG